MVKAFASTAKPATLQHSSDGQRRLLAKCLAVASAALTLPLPSHAQAGQRLQDADALARYWRHSERAIALIMLSLPRCPVCEIVREQQLLPLTRDVNYRDIGVFEMLMTNDTTSLPFAGRLNPDETPMTPKSFAKKLGIRVSPSLIFVSRRYMLAEPLIGYPSPDYYWAYLNERIEAARQAINMTS